MFLVRFGVSLVLAIGALAGKIPAFKVLAFEVQRSRIEESRRAPLNVEVRYFAVLREAAGSDREVLNLPRGATINELRHELGTQRPAVVGILADARFAVNEEFVTETFELTDGDFVAVIPPVSGG